MKKPITRQWLWYFSIAVAAISFYIVFSNFGYATGLLRTLFNILGPFVGGFVIAFLLHGPCSRIEGLLLRLKGKFWQKAARPIALTTVYLVLFGLLGLAVYLLIPALINSVVELTGGLIASLGEMKNYVESLIQPGGLLDKLGLEAQLDTVYAELVKTLTTYLTPDNILTALRGVGTVASSVVNVVIAVIVSLYMLGGREHLSKAVENLLSLFLRPTTLSAAKNYGWRSTQLFYKYLYGALLDAATVALVVSVGLLVFRVPYAVLLGITLGLLNLIPYFGAIIGCVGIAIITLLTADIYTAIGVIVFVVVIQQVDANIIQPRIVGGSVGLRPIYVLLSITVFGGLFGFWGILLAPPLMGIVQMLVRDASIKKKEESAQEQESAPEEETAPEE